MKSFKVKAQVRQGKDRGEFDGTVSDVGSKDEAWHATHQTLTRNGLTVSQIEVDEDN